MGLVECHGLWFMMVTSAFAGIGKSGKKKKKKKSELCGGCGLDLPELVVRFSAMECA